MSCTYSLCTITIRHAKLEGNIGWKHGIMRCKIWDHTHWKSILFGSSLLSTLLYLDCISCVPWQLYPNLEAIMLPGDRRWDCGMMISSVLQSTQETIGTYQVLAFPVLPVGHELTLPVISNWCTVCLLGLAGSKLYSPAPTTRRPSHTGSTSRKVQRDS